MQCEQREPHANVIDVISARTPILFRRQLAGTLSASATLQASQDKPKCRSGRATSEGKARSLPGATQAPTIPASEFRTQALLPPSLSPQYEISCKFAI